MGGVLRTIFLDLAGRPPYAQEVERWRGQPMQDLADELLGTEEFWLHWISEQLYYFLLVENFTPANEAIVTLPKSLFEGDLSVRDALHRVALSPSFDMRNPGADTFVTVVMEQLCGMTVQKNTRELEIGKTLYDGGPGQFLGRRGSSQSDVVRIAVNHKSAMKSLVAREYARVVRGDPDKREASKWVRTLYKDPYSFLEVQREWLLSEGYMRRLATPVPLENRLFVKALFVDLLGRLPTEDETAPLRDALDGLSDSRPLRSVLVRLLLDSGKVPIPSKASIESPTSWVEELFLRLLGREATQAELKAYVTVFHQPACRPQTILYALLSSPEYHRY